MGFSCCLLSLQEQQKGCSSTRLVVSLSCVSCLLQQSPMKPSTAAETPTAAAAAATTEQLSPAATPLPLSPPRPTPPPVDKQQQQQQCVFCSKEPLLPFRSSNCAHIFCYWCAASQPEHRPGGPWGPLEAEEGDPQLRCPRCAATIGTLLWGG